MLDILFNKFNLLNKKQDWYTRLGFDITEFKRKLISPADWIFSNKGYSYIQACIADRQAGRKMNTNVIAL